MRLLVRASTIRAPSISPPQPRIYALGMDRDTASATAAPADPLDLEAIGRDRDAGTAQPLLARPAQDSDRARAIPRVGALGQDRDRATATSAAQIVYTYAKTFVVERHEDLAAATPANVVLRVLITDAALKSTANDGRIQSASIYDLIFETLAASPVRLDHELESWDAATGDLWVAIRMPSWAIATDQFLFRARFGASL